MQLSRRGREKAGCVDVIAFLFLCVCLSHKTGTKRLVLFCLYLITCIHSKLAIISLRKRELAAFMNSLA